MFLMTRTDAGRACAVAAGDWLALASSRTGGERGRMIPWLERPWLLAAALVTFFDSRLRPARDLAELDAWASECWLARLANSAGDFQSAPGADRWKSSRRRRATAGAGSRPRSIQSRLRRCCRDVLGHPTGPELRRIVGTGLIESLRSAAHLSSGGRPFWKVRRVPGWGRLRVREWVSAVSAIGELADQQRQFADRLQREKLQSLREFAYGASHEINNPLANIAMRAEALLRGEADPDRARSLRVVWQQALRAHHMITDLMLFANPPEPDAVPVCVADLVSRSVSSALERLPSRSFRVEFCTPASPGVWAVDADQIAELAAALFRNAVEALDSTGTIRIELDEQPGSGFRLIVSDTGRGMDERTRRHLFDPFFSGREAGRGLGFGLSKAWVIAQAHGGFVRCRESRPGRTVFEAWIPFATSASATGTVIHCPNGPQRDAA